VILYYNWLGGYGIDWEKPFAPNGDRRRYFTDYRILHNLDNKLVMDEFDPVGVFSDKKYSGFIYKGNDSEEDMLFAIHGIPSILSDVENERIKSSL